MCAETLQDKWVGTPYLLHGRNRWGVDCVGLIHAMYDDVNVRFPGRDIPKSDTTDLLRILRSQFYVVRDELEAYDILLYRLEGTAILHAAVCVDKDRFVHILGPGRVKVAEVAEWQPQFIKAYRYRGAICQQQQQRP